MKIDHVIEIRTAFHEDEVCDRAHCSCGWVSERSKDTELVRAQGVRHCASERWTGQGRSRT